MSCRLVIHSASLSTQENIRAVDAELHRDFASVLLVHIGPKGVSARGAEMFTVMVATPAGLADHPATNGIIGTRVLVVERYDYDVIWGWLTRTVGSCEADSWPSSRENLRRFFHSEFDGMPPS